jgi:hypothetical protein
VKNTEEKLQMNKRDRDAFLQIQRRYRVEIMKRFERLHGRRTVQLALRNLDLVTDLYPGGSDSLPKICRHLRGMRGVSRSWNLARVIFVEMLKNLAEHLEAAQRKRAGSRA